MMDETLEIEGRMPVEDKMVHLARNALLVAGMEMGEEGDHWPVIKANIHALMHDYENLKIELAVQEQLRQHMGKIITDMEAALLKCTEENRARLAPKIAQMRETHEAMFAPLNPAVAAAMADENVNDDAPVEGYAPWKSSAAIIKSLVEE